MEKIDKLLNNEKGFTLIEVLAVIVISSIVLTVFYNVFVTGIKTYEKVGVEAQLRDEADYVLSDLFDVLNQSEIDKAEVCTSEYNGIPCLKFIQNKEFEQKKGIFLEKNSKPEDSITTIFLFDKQVIKILNKNGKIETFPLTSSPYELVQPKNISESYDIANITCIEKNTEDAESCKSGLIEMTIQIQNTNFSEDESIFVKPMILKSRFGF